MKLPKKVEIPKKIYEDENDIVADYLSDEYGWCIFGLRTVQEGDKYFAIDIEWDTSD